MVRSKSLNPAESEHGVERVIERRAAYAKRMMMKTWGRQKRSKNPSVGGRTSGRRGKRPATRTVPHGQKARAYNRLQRL
jgi:hypothetical protein